MGPGNRNTKKLKDLKTKKTKIPPLHQRGVVEILAYKIPFNSPFSNGETVKHISPKSIRISQ